MQLIKSCIHLVEKKYTHINLVLVRPDSKKKKYIYFFGSFKLEANFVLSFNVKSPF